MKRYDVSQINPWAYLLILILVTLLVTLSPLSIFSPPGAYSQTDNVTSENTSQSDNVTSDNTSSSDNSTSEPPPSTDNTTPDTDNVTPETDEEDLPSDNETSATDNKTIGKLLPTDNLTPELYSPGRSIKVVRPDEEALLLSSRGKVALRIPQGAVTDTTEFTLTEHALPGSTGMRMVNFFELDAFLADTLEEEGEKGHQRKTHNER